MAQQDLLDNSKIQELLTGHADKSKRLNSVIQNNKAGGQMLKIHNF